MSEASKNPSRTLTPRIPSSLVTEELAGLYGADVLAEMRELIQFYDIYEHGKEIVTEGTNGDYLAADLRSRLSASIIDKEARFLFAKMPDVLVVDPTKNKEREDTITNMNNLLARVFKKSRFHSKLLSAAKDCFIGRRVAIMMNFNADGIMLQFSPSLEFIYETDTMYPDKLTKIIAFYMIKDSQDKASQRLYKKKYWMAEDGYCHVSEDIYDGLGRVQETILPDTVTKFTWIPAFVIINDGLTGDMKGISEIEQLADPEGWFGRLNNADIDALRKGMNPIKYSIDVNPNTNKKLSSAAGAFWDLASDPNSPVEGLKGTVGVLESNLAYSGPLNETVKRLRMDMLDQMDIPDTRSMDLKVASGKALKSVYWGLTVRCDEKMLAWRPALEFLADTIIQGAILYPESTMVYGLRIKEPGFEYEINVDNQYPLPEDEAEEKQVDLAEVSAQVMSRKAYMIKWRGLTPDEADEELRQMVLEQETLENSSMIPNNDFGEEEEDEEQPEEGKDKQDKDEPEEEEGE